ncbi:MAG: dicarboxylate/amino acid:cation symporter [Holosporales bacterium]|jgi:Na+/H+-dicarboxylate symporter|nr:dicarboxylate/amino acid:cation symporter [Holosporales bacterium]
MCEVYKIKGISSRFLFFLVAVIAGCLCGLSGINLLEQLGRCCSEIFMRIFKCISMPVVSLSVIVALSSCESGKSMSIWKKTLLYTISTTLFAAVVSAVLYLIISPPDAGISPDVQNHAQVVQADYLKYFLDIIPDNLMTAFSEHKVLSVLLISVIIGISVRFINETEAKSTVISFFHGIHSVFFTITKFIIKLLPIGLFGFVTVSVLELKNGLNLRGMGSYFLVITFANLIQGIIVLPVWLISRGINPVKTFKAMSPALSFAFFSKSSSAVLPITMESAEGNLGIHPKISRFVFPLCATVNMNGCAAFIFTTVIYTMQNYGIEITSLTIITWILVATIAAIGNAGVPMGCFFLSASLLSLMDIPVPLLGVILPFYSVIDMLETSLNVWSDSCVASVVNKEASV